MRHSQRWLEEITPCVNSLWFLGFANLSVPLIRQKTSALPSRIQDRKGFNLLQLTIQNASVNRRVASAVQADGTSCRWSATDPQDSPALQTDRRTEHPSSAATQAHTRLMRCPRSAGGGDKNTDSTG